MAEPVTSPEPAGSSIEAVTRHDQQALLDGSADDGRSDMFRVAGQKRGLMTICGG